MKIAVYTIAKNEEQFAQRWADSCKDADVRLVCDTGSTDNTIKILKDSGVIVNNIGVFPWRFDEARNCALSLLPSDIDVCISLDMDEILTGNWREELEKSWNGIDRLNVKFSSHFSPTHITDHWHERIHSRHNYFWVLPVHEHLHWSGKIEEKIGWCDKIRMEQHPDLTKDRSSYMNLLPLSIKEEPNNWKLYWFLGEEYFKANRWNECIENMTKVLSHKDAWTGCKQSAIDMISTSLKNIG